MLVALLFYGYATGVFSSRKLEQATYDSVAFRYISGDEHPDHDTIANFRKRFLNELEGLFEQILEVAAELGTLRLGTVSLDGSKMQGNASKHKAMSWGHATKLERQLKGEGTEAAEAGGGSGPGGEAGTAGAGTYRKNWSGGSSGWQRYGKRRRRLRSGHKSATRESERTMKRS